MQGASRRVGPCNFTLRSNEERVRVRQVSPPQQYPRDVLSVQEKVVALKNKIKFEM